MSTSSLPPPPLVTALSQKDGTASPTWARWFQELQARLGSIIPAIKPPTPALLAQGGALYMGSGAPLDANGNNGDFYFRTDTPGTSSQQLYVRAAGSWTGIL